MLLCFGSLKSGLATHHDEAIHVSWQNFTITFRFGPRDACSQVALRRTLSCACGPCWFYPEKGTVILQGDAGCHVLFQSFCDLFTREETMVETIVCWYLRWGIDSESLHEFLNGGAKWISPPSGVLCVDKVQLSHNQNPGK